MNELDDLIAEQTKHILALALQYDVDFETTGPDATVEDVIKANNAVLEKLVLELAVC